MSVEIMGMVFKRYPRGGNERLLALAIADQAHNDGTRIFPSVETLAQMSAQSERSVQRLLHEMLASGWLQLVRKSTGRRGDCNEYRVSPEWIGGGEPLPPAVVPDRRTVGASTGAKLAPVQGVEKPAESVDNLSTTGDTTGLSGDTAVSPNPSLPVNTKNPPTPRFTGGSVENTGPPKSEQPSARERLRWRWADRRSEIEARGQQLGFGKWDESKVLPSLGGELFVQYAARVFVAHLQQLEVTVSMQTMLRSLASNNNWSEVVRSLASSADPNNDTPRRDE
jgi:hypothetical protein